MISTSPATSSTRSDLPKVFTVVAPARVNLIGEHTDYTGGLVLPMAIPFFTEARMTFGGEGYRFAAAQFPEVRNLATDDRSAAVGNWSDYSVGVLRQLQLLGITPQPFSLHLNGNVPLGSGLSSSASVEVASAFAMLQAACATLSSEEIALLCQRAENQYVSSPCGIMDQFVITMAKAGHALLIDTGTLAYEHLPVNGGELARTRVVICNSMVKHSVAAGEYGSIRKTMEVGQAVLVSRFADVKDLGDATMGLLEICAAEMPKESYLRCKHVISENERVRQAAVAMRAGNAKELGDLMHASHVSQRDDLGTSCAEIDFLVDAAMSLDGCYGARLTGGGFGGCTVNLVAAEHAESFAHGLKRAYRAGLGIDAETYLCEAVDGAMARMSGTHTGGTGERA